VRQPGKGGMGIFPRCFYESLEGRILWIQLNGVVGRELAGHGVLIGRGGFSTKEHQEEGGGQYCEPLVVLILILLDRLGGSPLARRLDKLFKRKEYRGWVTRCSTLADPESPEKLERGTEKEDRGVKRVSDDSERDDLPASSKNKIRSHREPRL